MTSARTIIRSLVPLVVVCVVTIAHAHEGHAPLPTKGAQVDLREGLVILSSEARKALGVQTGAVTLRRIKRTVLAYATVTLDWQSHRLITTPIAGRIARLHVEPGQTVVQGQTLAEIESTELSNLQLELLDAQNRAELSARTLARIEPLANDVISGREFAEAEAAHRESVAALEIAKSKLKRLRLTDEQVDQILQSKVQLRALPILSPLAGIAIHTDLALGKVVEPTEHLFEVMDLSSVTVRVSVLERDLGKVHIGQPSQLTVNGLPGVVFDGSVSATEAYIDSATHMGRVWVTLPNSTEPSRRLLPGMSGQAEITVSSPEKKLTVPKNALLTNGTEWFILVEEAATARGSEYRKRNVAVGSSDAEVVAITAGDVFPGDRVVTVGGHELATFFIQEVLRLSPEARKNLGITVEKAKAEYVDEVIDVDGAIDLPPEQRAVAASQLSGTVENILVKRGQSVRTGDVIAEISSLQFMEVQYELLLANIQLGLIEESLARLQRLGDSQLVAGKRLVELKSQYQATLYRRDSARERLQTLGLAAEQVQAVLDDKKLVELLPVRAPIDGAIVGFDKTLGQVIQADQPLFEIHDLTRIVVRAHLGERDAAKAPIGTKARVRVVAEPAFLGVGKVVRVGSVFEVNRTASAWIELAGEPSGTLYHDMLARVTLVIKTGDPVLAVPKAAVIKEGTRNYIFVEDASGRLTRRAVQTGRADDRLVEITSGLKAGEKVVVQGAVNLQTAYASLR